MVNYYFLSIPPWLLHSFFYNQKPHTQFLAPFSCPRASEEEPDDVGLIPVKNSFSFSKLSSSSMKICLHLHSTLQKALSPLHAFTFIEPWKNKLINGSMKKHKRSWLLSEQKPERNEEACSILNRLKQDLGLRRKWKKCQKRKSSNAHLYM